jgi:uncharacterized cupredoxin-like copper-binding protein
VRLRIVLLIAVSGVIAAAGPAAAAARPAGAVLTPIKIKVKMTEFSFAFSRRSVPKGSTVVFTVVNQGAIAHNIRFSTLSKGTPLVQPGSHATLRIKFTKKGRYQYLCTVPRHAEQGMAGSFLVK